MQAVKTWKGIQLATVSYENLSQDIQWRGQEQKQHEFHH